MGKTREFSLRVCVIGTAFLLTSTVAAFSQQSGTVRGNTTDASGQPLPHAMVRLITDLSQTRGTSRAWRYMAISDSFGNYKLDGVKPGSYVAMLYVDGRAANVLQSVTLHSGESAALNIALAADDPKAGAR
jgi:protocatechuate 3,4-dioxygenase beta subunit